MLAEGLEDPAGRSRLDSVTAEQELLVIFGVLHLVALAFGALLFVMFLKSDTVDAWDPPEDEDGPDNGGNDRPPDAPRAPTPQGGLPLPDAVPARVRLRDHRRLGDTYPDRPRRPEHVPAPERPRTPAR